MSRTTSTPIMNVHLNGQQVKFYNQVFRYCYTNNIIVENNSYSSESRYAGAHVFDPIPGLHEYVVPLDFESLYPSIMIAYNIDYTTYVPNCFSEIPDEKLNVLIWEDHIGCDHDPVIIEKRELDYKIKNGDKNKTFIKRRAELAKSVTKSVLCVKNKHKFLKHEYFGKGVLPSIIENLLEARKNVRKEMKNITDKDLLALMEQRQLSYKILGNSMYGATGVKSGKLPFMPIAMSVTYIGRQSIIKHPTK